MCAASVKLDKETNLIGTKRVPSIPQGGENVYPESSVRRSDRRCSNFRY